MGGDHSGALAGVDDQWGDHVQQSVSLRRERETGYAYHLPSTNFQNFKNNGYSKSGKGYVKLHLINQREDFSFALFWGSLKDCEA